MIIACGFKFIREDETFYYFQDNIAGRGWSNNMPDFSAEYLKAMYGNLR